MITDKLTVYGGEEDVTNICDLTAKCTKSMGLEPLKTVLYTAEDAGCTTHPDDVCVVLPHELKDTINGGRVLTFSEGVSMADVTLLNLQKRDTSICFEVLSGTSMSRVFVPFECGYTSKQVLACVSTLCAWGASVNCAVSAINSILK